VAVGLQEVGTAVGIEVGQCQAEAQGRAGRAQAQRGRAVGERPAADRPEGDRRPAQKVAHQEVDPAVAVDVAEGRAHPGQGVPPAIQRHARGEPDLLEPEPPPVLPEVAGGPIVGHEDVEAGIAHQVGDDHPQPPAAGPVDPGGLRDVGEPAPAIVPVEPVGLGGEVLGAAVVAPAVGSGAEGGGGRVVVEVGGEVKVEVAVAIEVGEGGRGAPLVRGDAGPDRHVLEPPAPRVPVEPLVAPAGHEEVVATVAVEVAHRRAHGVARARGPRAIGRVLEPPSSPVPVEPAGRVGLPRAPDDRPAVAEVEVEPAVAIGVNQGHAAAHDLGKVVTPPRADLEPERHPGPGRHVLEPGRSGSGRAGPERETHSQDRRDPRRQPDRFRAPSTHESPESRKP
jgi:hypothetical protein